MDYSVRAIRDEFKSKGIFYTPEELSKFMRDLLPAEVTEIYDPTCGAGNLLAVFDDSVKKYGQDINAEQVEYAKKRLVNFEGVAGDTLQAPAFMDRKFEYIISNYPFSIKWTPFLDERFEKAPVLPPPSKADYAFILHILHLLSDTGKAAVMGFPGILYRGAREYQIRRWIVEQNYIEHVIAIAGKKFTDTAIATVAIVFNKAKTTSDIIFVDDENNLERTVSLEEVRKNDFNLSVSTYVQKEEQKEFIDPLQLDYLARKNFCQKLRKELEFEKMVCEMEGLSFSYFIKQIKAIIKEFEK